eukprot:m.113163 g.113163  ORF g.113163 m.113163 type:complete len:821 (-) comp15352_c0_seq1:409-2871(-)
MDKEAKERGGSRAGAVLLQEIDQLRMTGAYESVRSSSHSLPSSTVDQSGSLRNLLLGEYELESHILHGGNAEEIASTPQSPASPRPASSEKGQKEVHSLQVASRYLQEVIAADVHAQDKLEAQLLLARIHLMTDRVEQAEAIYNACQPPPEAVTQMPTRRAVMVAHSYACRSTYHEDAASMRLACYEICAATIFSAAEKKQKQEPQTQPLTTPLSDIGHCILEHLRALCETGQASLALLACRDLLAIRGAVPFELRLEILALLADIHIDHPNISFHLPISTASQTKRASRASFSSSSIATAAPQSGGEDAVLALLIAEAELLAHSSRALDNVDVFIRIYDAILFLLFVLGLHEQAVTVLERAVAATYGADNFSLWLRLGAALELTNQHKYAVAVYKQCSLDYKTSDSHRVCQALVAAAKASLHLGAREDVQDCLEQAQSLTTAPGLLHSINQLLAVNAILHCRESRDATIQAEKLREAKSFLLKIDDDCRTADDFYLDALASAHARSTDDAIGDVWTSLSLCPTHRQSLQLFALLLTAKKDYKQALSVCHQILDMYPTDVIAMRIAGHIACTLDGATQALRAYKTFLASINTMIRDATRNGHVFRPLGPSAFSDEGVGSEFLSLEDVESAISVRSGRAVSSISATQSSGYDNSSRVSVDGTGANGNSILADMWLDCAEWFLALEQHDDVEKCIQQARQISGLSPAVDRFLGRRARRQDEVKQAIEHFEQALNFDEHDLITLIELGACLHARGEDDMAENRLQHALRIDPSNTEAHRLLGSVLRERGAVDASVQCMLRALQLGAHEPILPYRMLSCTPMLG